MTPPGEVPGGARIVIGDASPFVTAGLRAALEAGGMTVVAVLPDTAQALERALAVAPDAVLLSIDLPDDVPAAVRRLRAEAPGIELVVLADDADDATMLGLVHAGVHGILLGVADPVRVPHALAGVLAGEAAFPRRLVRVMADELARRGRHGRGAQNALTHREAEVLDLLAEGLTASAAADRLQVDAATVRHHAANAARKLGAADRAEALRAHARTKHSSGPRPQ